MSEDIRLKSSVGVIGAGIQGVCISLCLIKKGFKVTLVDRDEPGKSSASYQHMSMGVLRAVENRVPIVRAANTGISGAIKATGKLKDKTELFVEDFRVTQISPKTNSNTFYSLNGDVFSWLCLLLTGLLGFASRKHT